MLSTIQNTQRDSQSYIEKRRGREIEVTRRRRWGVKMGETNLASNQFPKCSPQPRTPREIHKVKKRRGTKEIEVTQERKGRVKTGESSQASNYIPK